MIVEDEDFFNYERNKQVLFNVRANDAKFFDDKDILVKVVDLPDSYSIRERLDTGAKVFELLANMEYKKEEFYGVYYKGGYIFYIDKVKKELMVANIYSYFQYTSVFIDRYSTYLNITDESIGAGKENTDMIAANDISTSAAARCKFLSSGNSNGYNDWFLPSVQEMQELNKNLYGKGFNLKENKPYWTSNCTGYSNASGVNYDGIGEEIALKRADEHYFVPVRSFIE